MRALFAILFALSAACATLAQQRPCVVGVSVRTVNLPAFPAPLDRETFAAWKKSFRSRKAASNSGLWGLVEHPIRGLAADAFSVRDKKQPIAVLSVEPDRRPRRVVFVAENGKRMTPKARKIESAVITDILSKAASNVSFALLTAGGPLLALGFGSSREEMRAAAEGLSKPPQSKSKGGSVLDAVMEATQLLRPHKPGDAIFVVAMRLEENNHLPWPLSGLGVFGVGRRGRATFKTVEAAVAASHIRVFGVQLGWVYDPHQLGPGVTCTDQRENYGCFSDFGSAAWNQLFLLSKLSLGSAVSDNTQQIYGRSVELKMNPNQGIVGSRTFITFPPSVSKMAREAEQMFTLMMSGCLLRLGSAGQGLTVTLSPSARRKAPWSLVLPADNEKEFECIH